MFRQKNTTKQKNKLGTGLISPIFSLLFFAELANLLILPEMGGEQD